MIPNPLGLAAALAGLAAPVAAGCTGGAETVLSCTARGGSKALEVCIAGREIGYAYGPRGAAPELRLVRDVAEIENRPWPGIGRTLWEETTFRNDGYAYLVHISVDRLDENATPEGGVIVLRGGATLARVDCDPGAAIDAPHVICGMTDAAKAPLAAAPGVA